MRIFSIIVSSSALAVSAAAAAQPQPVQSPIQALAQDAREYSSRLGVSLEEALMRLRAQEDSVAATDRLQQVYNDRLAGISVEHGPQMRIVVLLTGREAVPDQVITAGGLTVPVVFRTGHAATREQVVAAIEKNQAAIRSQLRTPPGLGHDPRTGDLLLLANSRDVAPFGGNEAMAAHFADLTGVPVRVRLLDVPEANMSIEGGARLEGIDPANGKRYACTTGFVVTDGSRTGVVTAAHCPDTLTYLDPQGGEVPLTFVGQWGWAYRDVQVHVGGDTTRPIFYADTAKTAPRTLASWRNRRSTRAGDFVCHRGERTGYSCSEVELVDYAPPGDLCGGPCTPTWVTVAGPSCKSGDSGGPIFLGNKAFGIVKGGNYRKDGTCNFYYYMSTDYLPDNWRLLY